MSAVAVVIFGLVAILYIAVMAVVAGIIVLVGWLIGRKTK